MPSLYSFAPGPVTRARLGENVRALADPHRDHLLTCLGQRRVQLARRWFAEHIAILGADYQNVGIAGGHCRIVDVP